MDRQSQSLSPAWSKIYTLFQDQKACRIHSLCLQWISYFACLDNGSAYKQIKTKTMINVFLPHKVIITTTHMSNINHIM